MKKVVYIVSKLNKSGLTSVIVNTAVNLDRNKFRPYILTLSDSDESKLTEYCGNNDIIVVSGGASRFGFLISKKIKNIIEEIEPDIIHAHCLRSFIYLSITKLSSIKIMTLHSIVKTNYRYEFGLLLGSILDKVVDFCITKHDRAIGVSKCIQDFYRDEKSLDIDYVVNGIELSEFTSVNARSYEKKLDNLIYIYTGSVSERKRVIDLTASFKGLSSKLLILGSGPLLSELEEATNNNSNIELLGRRSDVYDYLCNSDVFISISYSEGMPNSVIEAIACGLPCLLSDIPPHREIQLLFPECVKLVSDRNIYDKELVRLARCLYADFASLSPSSRAEVCERVTHVFSNVRMANDYSNIYNKVVL